MPVWAGDLNTIAFDASDTPASCMIGRQDDGDAGIGRLRHGDAAEKAPAQHEQAQKDVGRPPAGNSKQPTAHQLKHRSKIVGILNHGTILKSGSAYTSLLVLSHSAVAAGPSNLESVQIIDVTPVFHLRLSPLRVTSISPVALAPLDRAGWFSCPLLLWAKP
jgi:hypothetical protein